MHLRLATWNIHRSVGRDQIENPQRIATVLQELAADVIALQEVGFTAPGNGDVLETLAARARARALPGIVRHDGKGAFGNALLSRLPVRSWQLHDLSVKGREPRGLIEARLAVHDQTLRILATHLGLRARERADQAARIRALQEDARDGHQVVLGDLNEWRPYARTLRCLRPGAGPSRRHPATFPSSRPVLALDRIFVAPASAVTGLYVHRSALARIASDHLPLIAEIDIPTDTAS